MNWQPIETAPKTEEQILVVWASRVKIATFNVGVGEWQEFPDGDFNINEVTMWMPLPEPPKDNE